MTNGPQSGPSTLLWRLSTVIAAGLIGATVWLVYELVQTIRFLRAVAEFLGGSASTDWTGLALLFAVIGFVGIFLPGLYLRWAWPRSFPNSFRRPVH